MLHGPSAFAELWTTTLISHHHKGKLFWILMKQEMIGYWYNQLDHMEIICTLLHTDSFASTSTSIIQFFYKPDALPDALPTIPEH